MGDNETVARVTATPAAITAIGTLIENQGEIIFYQSGGCCAGSVPMCFEVSDFRISDHDRLLGFVGGAPVYIDPRQYERWSHTQLIIDVAEGEPEGFSLGPAEDLHFVTRSRVFTRDELAELDELDEGSCAVAGPAGVRTNSHNG